MVLTPNCQTELFAKLLPREEEHRLLKCAGRGDKRARERIVVSFLPLAHKIARKYIRYGLTFEDLCQEATIGLIKAIDKFDTKTFDNGFGPYAKWWIKAELDEYAFRNWSMVRSRNDRKSRRMPDIITRRGGFDSSLNSPSPRLSHSDPDQEWQDRLVDEDAVPVDEVYAEKQATEHVRAKVETKLAKLPARTQEIIRARWFTENEAKTLADLSAIYGVSRERIRQIEVVGLEKLGVPNGSMYEANRA